MLVTTHMLIAQKTYNCLPDYFKLRINLHNFIFGNVKPDLVYRLSTMSHCLHDSLPFVLEEIHNLQEQGVDSPQFSITLGVINHFMADFFCSAHYPKDRFAGTIKHLRYEIELHQTYKRMERMESLNMLKSSALNLSAVAGNNLQFIMRALESEFSRRKSSKENDIDYALKACNLTNNYILNNLQLKPVINTVA